MDGSPKLLFRKIAGPINICGPLISGEPELVIQ
jgi:hypothetical protein